MTMSIEEYRALEPEEDLLTRTIAEAKERGWMVQHVRPARRETVKGEVRWRSPIQGDKGGPDLLLARKGRVVFIELKSEKGTLSKDQKAWRLAITGIPDATWQAGWQPVFCAGEPHWYEFKPSQWTEIKRVLS